MSPDFLASIHFCEKLGLYTIILTNDELEMVNDPDDEIPDFTIPSRRRFLLNVDIGEMWFESEKEALDYMIDGQELY